MRTWGIAAVSVALVLGVACRSHREVDVRAALDIRHAQEEARRVLDFVEGKTAVPPALGPSASPEAPAAGRAQARPSRSSKGADCMLRMRERRPAIQALKEKGLGEDNRGYVELRSGAGLAGDEKNEAQKLVHAENTDRKALYKEIVRLEDNDAISLTKVEQSFAMERLDRAKPGDLVQLPPPGELFNVFNDSSAGKRLGDECKPEGWTKVGIE